MGMPTWHSPDASPADRRTCTTGMLPHPERILFFRKKYPGTCRRRTSRAYDGFGSIANEPHRQPSSDRPHAVGVRRRPCSKISFFKKDRRLGRVLELQRAVAAGALRVEGGPRPVPPLCRHRRRHVHTHGPCQRLGRRRERS